MDEQMKGEKHPRMLFLRLFGRQTHCDFGFQEKTLMLVLKIGHRFVKTSAYISITGCIWQFNMFSVSSVTECFLLTVMSYDRYLAICKPLHYASIMTWRSCIFLVMSCWSLGFLLSMIVTVMIHYLHFCGPYTIDHLFCDYTPLMQLSCSDTTILKMTVFLIATPGTVLQPFFIIATYINIILNILRISSSSKRQKAFSTCSSHLSVVCLYYGTLIATYATPTDGRLSTRNKLLSLIYTVGTPMMNPIIYTLKNKEIQAVIRKYVDQHQRK
ncbi:olfactory receptor 10A7-like [Xenopus laevis]|uniref:Olfactory receptor n=1 Tax=Xenopus laevis TaxID=8355 RepID=A0A8J1MIT8_XENLA|nr:olfactory receptor 10A7-like [Xenopus laevis]